MRDDRVRLLRFTAADGAIVFDGPSHRRKNPGRGAHVHARPACLGVAPRRVSRALKTDVHVDSADLAQRLVVSCEEYMALLLFAARRNGGLAVGADAARAALRDGAPLVVLPVDAGPGRSLGEWETSIVGGRAIAWKTKRDLGELLGENAVAVCAVRSVRIAAELKKMRASLDAGMAAARDGANCSRGREAQ